MCIPIIEPLPPPCRRATAAIRPLSSVTCSATSSSLSSYATLPPRIIVRTPSYRRRSYSNHRSAPSEEGRELLATYIAAEETNRQRERKERERGKIALPPPPPPPPAPAPVLPPAPPPPPPTPLIIKVEPFSPKATSPSRRSRHRRRNSDASDISVRSFRDVKRKVSRIFTRLSGVERETEKIRESVAREKAIKEEKAMKNIRETVAREKAIKEEKALKNKLWEEDVERRLAAGLGAGVRYGRGRGEWEHEWGGWERRAGERSPRRYYSRVRS